MSHSVYDNSPFDSNRNGRIDVSEQANIHETYYKDSNYYTGSSRSSGSGVGLRFAFFIFMIILANVQPFLALIILGIWISGSICGIFR